MFKKVRFLSGELELCGIIALPKVFNKGVVFLHGGGRSNVRRYTYLQHYFELKQIASLAFDSRGCGQSQGSFEEGSLSNRIVDAEAALTYFQQQTALSLSNIFIWGSSMGGHIACLLSEKYPHLEGIVLQSAAAYGNEAESLKFNQEFSQFIRQPQSWRYSPAFTTLAKFKGRILVVYAEHDTVIPEEVKEQYKTFCKRKKDDITIKGGTHNLLRPQNPTEQQALEDLAKLSAQFISDALMNNE